MKKILVLTLTILFVATVPRARAQSFAEIEMDGKLTGKVNLEKSLDDSGGIYIWSMGDKEWAEVLAGYWFRPYRWMKVSVAAGVETADNIGRYGVTVWLGNDKLSSLTIFEHGGSGRWYKQTVLADLEKLGFHVGLISQTEIGTGPLVEVSLPKKLSLSGGFAYNGSRVSPIIAFSRSF